VSHRESAATPWWADAVIYQVYPRSFADSDGDGVGDLAGARSRLDHVQWLGADAVWLSPFYRSPQIDAGYDVSDYRDVDPVFGDLGDVDALLAEAHRRGLRVIVDLVPNHTSSEHPWFRAALAMPSGSHERARYVFRRGSGPDGSEPPNDWRSVFGGSAWTRIVEPDGTDGEWYLHLFDTAQPDLNWDNEEVRAEFDEVLRFWLDRGVDGFRIDVAHGLMKDERLPDVAGRFRAGGPAPSGHPHWDRDAVHDIYRRWRRILDEYDGDRAFVAEAWVKTPAQLARYVRPDELHTAFNFGFLLAPWEAAALRSVIDESLTALSAVGAPATWVLSNHDVVRVVTRLGGGSDGLCRARAAALLMLALPGGAYVYQGEELGLPEVTDLPDAARQDPTFARTHGERRGRDGCRVPLPWEGDRPPYGFTAAASGWLPQPDDWASSTVQRQSQDPASMLSLYRRALEIRAAHPALGAGCLQWIDSEPGVLAFAREPGFACVVNVGATSAAMPAGLVGAQLLLCSATPETATELAAGSALWLQT
jgi:alpha-glucosidase